jgi:hypothetical protein
VRTTGLVLSKVNAQVGFYPPPSGSQFTQGMQEVGQKMGQLFNTAPADYTVAGLTKGTKLVVEVVGLFCVGEIIGRGQIVGYAF